MQCILFFAAGKCADLVLSLTPYGIATVQETWDHFNITIGTFHVAASQVAVYSSDGRAAIFSTAQLLPKTTKNTQGVAVLTCKKKATLERAEVLGKSGIVNASRYRTKTIPSSGALLKPEDLGQQQERFEV